MEELPEGIDEELWFKCPHSGGRDFLVEANPHTFPGRMVAFCPHDPMFPYYNVSIGEIEDCSHRRETVDAGFCGG